jgi:hypothetical protein
MQVVCLTRPLPGDGHGACQDCDSLLARSSRDDFGLFTAAVELTPARIGETLVMLVLPAMLPRFEHGSIGAPRILRVALKCAIQSRAFGASLSARCRSPSWFFTASR